MFSICVLVVVPHWGVRHWNFYGSFYDAVGNLDYIASNWWTGKNLQGGSVSLKGGFVRRDWRKSWKPLL